MLKPNPGNRRIITIITLIIAGETIFFLPFVIARIFRPTLLQVFNISNTELGTYFSVYGIVAMLSYFFGGPLADKYPARNLMGIALWLTGLGGILMLFIPLQGMMMVLYGFWGFTTIFLFWAAMIRATREWGSMDFQGRAFGWLEGGRGATAALLGTLTLLVFSSFNPDSGTIVTISTERIKAFQSVILLTSTFTIFCGFLVWWIVPLNQEYRQHDVIQVDQIGKLLKIPSVWILSFIIICAYVGYKITDDFSLYANEVLGFNEIKSAGLGTGALWMRAIAAIFAGYFADKIKASKIISLSFVFSIAGGVMIASGILENTVVLVILNLIFVMIGVYGVRAIYFALIQEARISIFYTGTVVGIVSVLGFTPDIFMSPWMGYLLDHHPGTLGHRYVFWVLSGFAILGFMASLAFLYCNKSSRNNSKV